MAVVEPPLSDNFLAGVQAGFTRAERDGLRVPSEVHERLIADPGRTVNELSSEALAAAQDLMSRDAVSGRFEALFAEMVTVAALARDTYGDDALTASEIETYLRHSYSIFNSFRHA